MARLWTPGIPKTWRTPSTRSASTTDSPPVRTVICLKKGALPPSRLPRGCAAWSQHRLEAAVDRDVHEGWPGVGEARGEHVPKLSGLLHALSADAERTGEPGVVDLRLDQVHAWIDPALGRGEIEAQHSGLEDRVRGVVRDDVRDREPVVRRRP